VRFTLEPFGDLEVTEGATLGECRADLARLTGTPPTTPLGVAGVLLTEDQVAGVPPWVAGARIESEPGRVAPTSRAADRPRGRRNRAGPPARSWHLAVVDGPDAGAIGIPGDDGAVRVGRGGPARPGHLPLHDPSVSRRHVVVRTRGGRWVASDVGSANGTRVRHGHRRLLRRGPLHAGDRLVVGASTLELRAPGRSRRLLKGETPDPSTGPAGHSPGDSAGTSPSEAGRTGPSVPSGPSVPVLTWLLPMGMSAVLAVMTRNPVYLLFALTGPAGAAVPALVQRSRTRHRASARPGLGPDAAASSCRLRAGATALPQWWPMALDGLAVVAEPTRGIAVARALVGSALLADDLRLAVLHPVQHASAWSWCRWLEARLGPAPDAAVGRDPDAAAAALRPGPPALVVSHGCTPWRAALDRWWLRTRTPSDGVLLVVERADEVPAWCPWVLTVGSDGTAVLTGPEGSHRLSAPSGSATWADEHARAVAARDAARRRSAPHDLPSARDLHSAHDLPDRVGLADLGVPDDLEGLLTHWGLADAGHGRPAAPRPLPGLVVPLGAGVGGAVVTVDLLADGPHALVAGTTGSGKSELLQSLVLGLALLHPPTELAIVLVDYKGGAGLGRCSGLPHVVGQVTDLDPAQAGRAIEGLRSELHRREAVLAAAGVADVEDLRGPAAVPGTRPLPRLLVVVDEFRAMTEDLPDFVPALVRLAAQGRSLGFHLVLATQRPGGAVSAQMRANLALRICLRVTEPGDSTDVLEVAAAAGLPQDRPGRALLRRGNAPVEVIQTAWAALGRAARGPLVRRAAQWESFGVEGSAGATSPSGGGDHAEHLAALAARAAALAGLPAVDPIWSPPLPAVVPAAAVAELAHRTAPPAGDGLALGLTDPAGAQGRGVLRWDGRGLLLVAGRGGSGRSTAATTVAQAALDAGWHVHLVTCSGPLQLGTRDRPRRTAGLGTVLTAADPRGVARLLTILLANRDRHRCLLVLDDVAAVQRALDRFPRGCGTDLLDRLLREGRHQGVGCVVTGDPRELSRWSALADHRLVLPVADVADDVALGVPRAVVGVRTLPGRAVSVRAEAAELCQIALPGAPGRGTDQHGTAPHTQVGEESAVPVRLAPLPLLVPVAPGRAGSVVLGVGGDDAGPVGVGTDGCLLVVGPTGTGRTTALAAVVGGLRASGRRVGIVARDGPLADLGPDDAAWFAKTPAGAADLVRRCAGPGAPGTLVIDDLDLVGRADLGLDEELAGWVLAAETGDLHHPRLIASARTDRAAAAYRGACAALRGSGDVLVLAPSEPGSPEVAGVDLTLQVDPARPRHPGRGVLVQRGRPTPIQVALSAERTGSRRD